VGWFSARDLGSRGSISFALYLWTSIAFALEICMGLTILEWVSMSSQYRLILSSKVVFRSFDIERRYRVYRGSIRLRNRPLLAFGFLGDRLIAGEVVLFTGFHLNGDNCIPVRIGDGVSIWDIFRRRFG
jgi:hypothetical protein